MSLDVFCPADGVCTVALAVATSSQAVALIDPKTGNDDRYYRVAVTGSDPAIIAFGKSGIAVTAPANGAPANGITIPAGGVEIFRRDCATTHLAALCRSGSTEVEVTTGRGV
ncbi:hypothetical protein [Microvirga sp. TS319]|uniref:hypothetical protein n=1 Tax=Microvirga sp. TS319 TaxID=3241165 RepID=UPI00351A2CA6